MLLATRTLERQGYRVTGFTSAAAALGALRADPGGFELVVDFHGTERRFKRGVRGGRGEKFRQENSAFSVLSALKWFGFGEVAAQPLFPGGVRDKVRITPFVV